MDGKIETSHSFGANKETIHNESYISIDHSNNVLEWEELANSFFNQINQNLIDYVSN